MKINILLCDTFPGLLPDYIPSYVSMFTRLFDSVSTDTTYEVYRAMDGQQPDLTDTEAVHLITGCNEAAYDDTPWIVSLLNWIRRAHEAQLKLVGICFGHQAIAQALGGRVEQAPQGWGTGIRQSDIVDEVALSHFPDGHLRLFYNHHDQVVALPSEATLMSTSAFCPVESFRIGRRILAFQGHPEYVPEYALHLLDHHAADEPAAVKDAARESIRSMRHQGEDVARWVLSL